MRHLLLLCLAFAGFASAQNTDPFPNPPNVKGIQVQMTDDALALGIHHATINVNITALYSPQSKPEAGEFVWNQGYLASLDRQIKPLSDAGIIVYLIIIAYPSKNPAIDAVVLHPGHRQDYKFTVGAVNTANRFFPAVIGMLAERWSSAHPEHGRVWGWIIGNEANSHFLWNNLGLAPLETAVSEYEKAVRLAHEAIRRHSQQARVYLSFDHHWSIGMHNVSPQEATPGRDFLDTFARLARERGDFDWNVAWHPYPEDLGNPRAWADKNVTHADDTIKVTFKNLDVLPKHLEKSELLYQGKPRRIILSEQGFHTLLTPDGEKLQAAAYAYAWEKIQPMPTVDAFIYHRHVDHAHEGGLRLGLWRNAPNSVADPHSKKLIYELFKKAGTPEWRTAADTLLPVTGLKAWNE
ncbi:DUF5722 domain-containing protein [Prosthecobacter sp.]|uniref:DUF5722 domain-containing protein n=1 Tax=Prosthecobacter sp. TaxID=1965333 RepID=UPI002ABD0436|nr:DUF5722 domain-containing protein [Prosthecobacter sp.]MDZ4404720.1 DUF5722 domain-containing protein [Prosthecobacter sp.]